MQEVEAALRKENKRYKNDVVAMETAITERLGYLQRHKVRNAQGFVSFCLQPSSSSIFNTIFCSFVIVEEFRVAWHVVLCMKFEQRIFITLKPDNIDLVFSITFILC